MAARGGAVAKPPGYAKVPATVATRQGKTSPVEQQRLVVAMAALCPGWCAGKRSKKRKRVRIAPSRHSLRPGLVCRQAFLGRTPNRGRDPRLLQAVRRQPGGAEQPWRREPVDGALCRERDTSWYGLVPASGAPSCQERFRSPKRESHRPLALPSIPRPLR